MRRLTISRHAIGYDASYGTVKIYIEDNSATPDIIIKGVPCRFLGKLNSNESETFEIDEREQKVFAVISKTSRNYKYDYRVIEAGYDDVVLSGKSSADRLLGCMFYFDGETPSEIYEDLKRWKNKMYAVMIGAVFVSVAIVVLVRVIVKTCLA